MTRAQEGADDSRQAPRYGEYATPEEVAALRGVPAPALPDPEQTRVADTSQVSTLRRFDRPVTVALIAFGILNLLQYAGALLEFDYFLEVATKGTFAEAVDFADAARVGGVVLFLLCLALVVGSGAIAVLLLRRRRVAFWVPLVAGALSVLGWIVVLVVIMLLTPGALPSSGS